MRRISDQERRGRLGRQHLLADPASEPLAAARSVVGLHSTDPATVVLSVWARLSKFEVVDLERALYTDRSLIRILGMRRTMFVVPATQAALVHHSSTAAMIGPERALTANMIEQSGIADDGARWVQEVCERTFRALQAQGEATAAELREEIPELRKKITIRKKDGSVAGTVGVSTRILFLLGAEARIVRARPKGSWLSSLYRWVPLEDWMGAPFPEISRPEAQAELIGTWLRSFGPATEVDIKWWTGWPAAQVRNALKQTAALEVKTEQGPGYLHPDDIDAAQSPDPWVALLPSLDPTVMGWKQRDWYLGDHAPQLFDRNGNAGPTVWVDGRVVGGWAQRRTGEIVYRILDDVGAEAAAQIEAKAAHLQVWLGETVVTPRFRAPLEKELCAVA